MKQIRTGSSVASIAGRRRRQGSCPAPREVFTTMGGAESNRQNNLSLKKEPILGDAVKTHISVLPSHVQNLLADEFELKVIALREKLEAEYAEIKRDKNQLADLNEQQSSRIDSLTTDLKEAAAKVAEQGHRIARLEIEVAAEREARQMAEQRIRDVRLELTRVEHKLDDPCPDSRAGA